MPFVEMSDEKVVELDVAAGRPSLIRVTRDMPAIIEAVLPRIYEMSHRMGGNALGLISEVMTLLNQGAHAVCIWAVLEGPEHRLVGHAVAQIKEWNGHLVGWVTQVEMDHHAGVRLREQWLLDLDCWVHEGNALLVKAGHAPVTECMMLTKRHSEAWTRHAAFKEAWWLYKREV